MQTYVDALGKLVDDRGGVLLSKDVDSCGISRKSMQKYIKLHGLEQVKRGVYVKPDAFVDGFMIWQSVHDDTVYSHECALFLHDLTDREPMKYVVTAGRGAGITSMLKNGIVVHQVDKVFLDLGVTTVPTMFGHDVRCYDMERTMCDIIRSRKKIDAQVYHDALKRYAASSKKRVSQMMLYAYKMGILKLVQSQIGVLL